MKVNYINFFALTASLFCHQLLPSQGSVVVLENPSFEGTPNLGGANGGNGLPRGWYDCGFKGESPPDVHPLPNGGPFEVSYIRPSDGHTYIGLVARDLDTWESLGQPLKTPLIAGQVYRFSIDLCRAKKFISPSRTNNSTVNFTTPLTLRIWGGNSLCEKKELLATSPAIENTEWGRFEFELAPTSDYVVITFEAFYKSPSELPYNGNLMLDNASDFSPLTVEEIAARNSDKQTQKAQVNLKVPTPTDSLRHEFTQHLMGTEFRIVAYFGDTVKLKEAVEKAFSRVALLEKVFSDYDENSEVSWLSKDGKESEVSDELWDVLQYALEVSRRSDGAFDVSVGALSKIWRKAIRQQAFPSLTELNRAMTTVGYEFIKMKEGKRTRTIKLEKPGMQLDFGGIAAGYAVDEAMAWLREYGINCALVDGGGDILLGDAPPGRTGWEIDVPEKLVNGELMFKKAFLSNTAITASGDTYRYLEHKGIRYSHIIDPRTGFGLTNRRVATVTAPTCIAADVWATTACVGISRLLTVDLKAEKVVVKVLEEK